MSLRLGIDFGTTHTVAVVETADGRVEPLLFDSSPLLSSAVFASPDGRLLTGRDGERSARLDPTRYEPNPKRRIDEATILLGPTEYPLPQVIGAVLGRVVTEATRAGGGTPNQTVLTYPATWGRQRKDILAQAAAGAGLDAVVLVPEPVAAAAHFTDFLRRTVRPGETVAVYDFGAGTFDASVVRRRADRSWEVAACEGLLDVGGLDLDAVLVGRIGEIFGAANPDLWIRLANPDTDTDRRASRAFWDDVRDAKEQLSRNSTAAIHVPLFDTDTHVTREEFERAAQVLLTRTVNVIAGLLTRIGPTPLAGLYLVGGSSRVPLISTMLHQRLAIAPTLIDQPELIVALGSLRAVPLPVPGAVPLPSFGTPVVSAPPTALTDPPWFGMPVSGSPVPVSATPTPVSTAPLAPPPPPGRPGRLRWALIAAVAVVLLAGGVAAAQQGLHLFSGNSGANPGRTAQRPPQQRQSNPPARAGTSSGTAVDQSVDIKKTVWYGGKKFTLDTARYRAGKLQVDVSVENLSAKDDDLVWNVPVYFAADGHDTRGKVAGIHTLPGSSTTKGTFDFSPDQPITNIKAGVVSIGDSETVQASVALTDPSLATTLEPKRLNNSAGQYPVGRLVYTVHYCELRGDYSTTHRQAVKGSYLVVCDLDVTCINDSGDSIGPTDFRLKLPDGSLVTASMWQEYGASLPLYRAGQQALDQKVGFSIRWPAPGAYTLQLFDTDPGGKPSSGHAEMPLPLS